MICWFVDISDPLRVIGSCIVAWSCLTGQDLGHTLHIPKASHHETMLLLCTATSRKGAVQLYFGTIDTLFMDPADFLEWAVVIGYRKVQSASIKDHLPRPRMFDEDIHDISLDFH